jgi:TonB family protein
MDSSGRKVLKLLVDQDPASPQFRSGVRDALHPSEAPSAHPSTAHRRTSDLPGDSQFDLRGVFVQQKLPWGRFVQSALLHGLAAGLIWMVSISWMRQQKILSNPAFDRSSLVTYTPEEYLPPLDTGAPEMPPEALKAAEAQTADPEADPEYAKQPVLSVPPEADNRSQTIVAPPDLKLNHDVALPNIIATGSIVPAVPLDATRAPLTRIAAAETQVIAPAPDVQFAQDRAIQSAIVRSAMKSEVIAPPPEVMQSVKGQVGLINIGPTVVVAPAPQLTLEEQHTLAGRSNGNAPAASAQPVGPPPSMASSGGASGSGRLIALGLHPVAPSGPVAVPAGNRRGTFAANPQGKPGAAGTPELASGAPGIGSSKTYATGSLPTGLHVGAGDSGGREMARAASLRAMNEARDPTAVPAEKATELDRKVFGDKTFHTMALNMPNLNSATGSWVIHFAELDPGHKEGELTAPRSTEKSDPGYPLELIRANVHGMVSLYAVIDADGKVSAVRVLNSPDDRLDSYATKALYLCKFRPAERDGKPVALEALVMIPFRTRRSF